MVATQPKIQLHPPTSPVDYTLYIVGDKCYVRPKSPGAAEREISKREYDDLLETKNNSHSRLHKKLS